MASATVEPKLPAGLELVHLASADSARAEAIRRALAGAPEGTLVWVEQPTQPTGRHARPWKLGSDPGLHAALVLRPGLPPAECAELAPVTAVALGRSLGDAVEAMTELHYRWPNDLLVDGGKAAGIWLDGGGAAERVDWLVVSWAVNTRAAPATLGHDAAAIEADGASGSLDHGALLQAIARQLVAAITAWDEDGAAPLLDTWRRRMHPHAGVRMVTADGRTRSGRAEEIDADGAMTLRTDGGTERVTLQDFFGLPQGGRVSTEPGVRCLEPDCGDTLVHRYQGSDYGLEDIPELFQLGRLAEGEEGEEGEERLILEPGEIRELKMLADAYSFDFDEGLVELCLDLHRFAIERAATRFVFAADF